MNRKKEIFTISEHDVTAFPTSRDESPIRRVLAINSFYIFKDRIISEIRAKMHWISSSEISQPINSKIESISTGEIYSTSRFTIKIYQEFHNIYGNCIGWYKKMARVLSTRSVRIQQKWAIFGGWFAFRSKSLHKREYMSDDTPSKAGPVRTSLGSGGTRSVNCSQENRNLHSANPKKIFVLRLYISKKLSLSWDRLSHFSSFGNSWFVHISCNYIRVIQ